MIWHFIVVGSSHSRYICLGIDVLREYSVSNVVVLLIIGTVLQQKLVTLKWAKVYVSYRLFQPTLEFVVIGKDNNFLLLH